MKGEAFLPTVVDTLWPKGHEIKTLVSIVARGKRVIITLGTSTVSGV